MAGDWIKMRMDLQTHPKVVRILSATGADKFRVIGGLHAVWCVFDQHSEDGTLTGYSLAGMDAVIGWQGFSEAVAAVGWLEETAQGLVMPEFSEHNGKSAKRRAEDQKRKRVGRASDNSPQSVRKTSADDADKKRTREEKRREEVKNTPPTPSGGQVDPEGFAAFWQEYPRKIAKENARKAWRRQKLTATHLPDLLAALRAAKSSEQWSRDNGKFIPHPATWLNGRRWEDEDSPPGEGRELSEWELAELYAQQQSQERAA